jgi:hypothetical protein
MAKKETFFSVSSVRAFSAFLSILWIIGLATLFLDAVLILFILLKFVRMNEKGIIYSGSFYFASLLAVGVFLWIVYYLRKLVKTVEKNHPFDQANPGRIRRIAFGVFVWMPLRIFSKIMMKGFSDVLKTKNFFGLLVSDVFMLVFMGTAILVIAKLFEAGVRLEQDQTLTI